GGHAAALLAAAPSGRLLGLDRDSDALARTRERLAADAARLILRHASFADLAAILEEVGWPGADAVLLDLRVSSLQLDDRDRGFSFGSTGPLDMRMDRSAAPSAAAIVNEAAERDLAHMIAEYGEERRARGVARAIVRARPLATTADLARVVRRVVGRTARGIDPATRTFQAIRIVVNDELGALERFLADGWRVLRPGGRLAVLAYHSLEDRRVKGAFRRWAARCICPPG